MQIENIMKLSNVSYTNEYKSKIDTWSLKTPITKYAAHKALTEVVWQLATTNPYWTFRISDGRFIGDGDGLRVTDFKIFQDGEELGAIGTEWFRGNDAVYVRSRLAKSNRQSRGHNIQYTTKPKVALSLAKKLFMKRTLGERVEDAQNKVSRLFNSAGFSVKSSADNAMSKMNVYMLKFVFAERLGEFKNYLERVDSPAVPLKALDDFLRCKEEQEIIQDVVTRYRSGNSCLIISDDGKYTVQFHDKTPEIYDDSTLPENLRGKLGMLKLVGETQMVSGTGCRVSNNVFVLIFD